MELNRNAWNAAVKLAVVVSSIAVLVALVATAASDIPQAAIVLPVIVVAFMASWIQTGRARREPATVRTMMTASGARIADRHTAA
ncbi:MAG: hypothetical protein WBP59_07460 [Ilumatobacteraceae bacterium]